MKRDHVSAQPGNWLGPISLLSFLFLFADDAQSNAQMPTDAAPRGSPVTPVEASNWIEAANRDFRQFCARCHGSDFTGGEFRDRDRRIPNFTDRSWQNRRSDAQLIESIKDGKGSRMPSFDDRLDEERIQNLVRLVRNQVNAAASAASRRAIRVPRIRLSPADFERKFAELEDEFEVLQKQFREIVAGRKKSA